MAMPQMIPRKTSARSSRPKRLESEDHPVRIPSAKGHGRNARKSSGKRSHRAGVRQASWKASSNHGAKRSSSTKAAAEVEGAGPAKKDFNEGKLQRYTRTVGMPRKKRSGGRWPSTE